MDSKIQVPTFKPFSQFRDLQYFGIWQPELHYEIRERTDIEYVPFPRIVEMPRNSMNPANPQDLADGYPTVQDTQEIFNARVDRASANKFSEEKAKMFKDGKFYLDIAQDLGHGHGENTRHPQFKNWANSRFFLSESGSLYQEKRGEKIGPKIVVPREEVHRILCWAHYNGKKGSHHAGRDVMTKLLKALYNMDNFERGGIIMPWIWKCKVCSQKKDLTNSGEEKKDAPKEREQTQSRRERKNTRRRQQQLPTPADTPSGSVTPIAAAEASDQFPAQGSLGATNDINFAQPNGPQGGIGITNNFDVGVVTGLQEPFNTSTAVNWAASNEFQESLTTGTGTDPVELRLIAAMEMWRRGQNTDSAQANGPQESFSTPDNFDVGFTNGAQELFNTTPDPNFDVGNGFDDFLNDNFLNDDFLNDPSTYIQPQEQGEFLHPFNYPDPTTATPWYNFGF